MATGSGIPSRQGSLAFWRMPARSILSRNDSAHSDSITDIAFAPNDQQVVTGSADFFVKIFRVQDASFIRGFEGHSGHVNGVDWRADGRFLVSGGGDGEVKIWDAETGDQSQKLTDRGKFHTAIDYHPYGAVILAAGDTQARFGTQALPGVTAYLHSLAASATADIIVAGDDDGRLLVWDKSRKLQQTITIPPR